MAYSKVLHSGIHAGIHGVVCCCVFLLRDLTALMDTLLSDTFQGVFFQIEGSDAEGVLVNWPQWVTHEKLIIGAFALIGLAVAATYQIQQGRIDDRDLLIDARDKEIDSLMSAKVWDVPNTITRLNEISQKLQAQFASIEKLNALQKENGELLTQTASLKKEQAASASKLAQLAEQNALLKSSLNRAFVAADVIDLEEGRAADLVKNQVTLGVESVYLSGGILGRLGNQPLSLRVGEAKEISVLGKNCRLTLSSTRTPKASFSFFCYDRAD
jgi:hypothetical protein